MSSRILIPATLAAVLLAVFLGAASAPAEQTAGAPSGPHHLRDLVLSAPPPGAARKLARMSTGRYPVGDAQNRTVKITLTTTCEITCTAKDPNELAAFMGTLPHRDEIQSLEIVVASRGPDLDSMCGSSGGVLACYYPGNNQMVVPGDDFVSPGDNAFRLFVIAHEYGHHVANHRRNPPFVPTVSYGTKRWVTHEHVCQGSRQGRYYPGNQGNHYYDNPGEAFAEAYAFARFPNSGVVWNWDDSLRPDATAYRLIRADARRPWLRPVRLVLEGNLPATKHALRRRIATPLDGDVVLALRGAPDAQLDLIVRNASGRVVARSRQWGARDRLRLESCGQRALQVTVRRPGTANGGAFRLIAIRP